MTEISLGTPTGCPPHHRLCSPTLGFKHVTKLPAAGNTPRFGKSARALASCDAAGIE